MRAVAAIVEPAIDVNKVTREILADIVAVQDGSAQAAKHRVSGGRRLIAVKKALGHGNWSGYVAKLGISERTAREWMALAEHVAFKSAPGADLPTEIPTRREVADARRVEREPVREPDEEIANDEPREPARVPHSKAPPKSIDIGRELLAVHHKVMDVARDWPTDARRQLAQKLRDIAATLEDMK